ncbi:Ger(x)C family spore germination protein [Cohnella sp. CFH 77786]|uniref:Ger(x)C family spore germination protein n=1 Tax=Cohnella sp. CFH 77786 TaxID=2662265 RepID=UPI001C60DFCF|nr:Ger(x)C family spore germination protein [Cohnella sp. CFH 77786]MBW5448124.1 Ger(x)C family spore germination protein [Cohnella sp. CFH 77786]
MTARRWILFLLIASLILQMGCWDIKSIQDVNYFTGIGIDYKNGKYELFVQQLDFSNLAKSEGGKTDKPGSIWIGHASGVSVAEAVDELYQSSQQLVFWGHVGVVLLSENVLKHDKLLQLFDALNRSREIRYTPWIYGTKSAIPDIFTTEPFFNLSPLNSILFAPERNYRQRSHIPSIRNQRFFRELRDPGTTLLLPSINIETSTWSRNRKADPKLTIDGYFVLRSNAYKGWFSEWETTGLRWIESRNAETRLVLKEQGHPLATVVFHNPSPKIRIAVKNGKPEYTFELRLKGRINELWKPVTKMQLEQKTKEAVRQEIESAFRTGHARKADLFRLEHQLYRRRFRAWKDLTDEGRQEALPERLAGIQVEVRIEEVGMFKLYRKHQAY